MRANKGAADPRPAGPPYPFYCKAALRVMYSDDHAVSARLLKVAHLPTFSVAMAAHTVSASTAHLLAIPSAP